MPAPNQEFPFIGFDTKTGKVYGNSGCNRMMGSFDVNAKPGTIDLGALGSTRMACPDMTVEKNVLSALGQVKKYKVLGENNMANKFIKAYGYPDEFIKHGKVEEIEKLYGLAEESVKDDIIQCFEKENKQDSVNMTI